MNNYLEILIFLIAGHLAGDVLIRPNIVHMHKGRSNLVMLFHCYIWATATTLPLLYYNIFTIYKFLFLLGGHFIIDKWKGWVDPDHCWVDEDGRNIQVNKWVVIDQLLHLIQLVIVIL